MKAAPPFLDRWLPLCSTLLLLSTGSAADSSFLNSPQNMTIARGTTALFTCAVQASQIKNDSLAIGFKSKNAGNYNMLKCRGGTKDITMVSNVEGRCKENGGTLEASWRIPIVLMSDNETMVICDAPDMKRATAYLVVYDNNHNQTIIGCAIGGFFGIIIVFGFTYLVLKRSERFQKCLKGKPVDDETTTTYTM